MKKYKEPNMPSSLKKLLDDDIDDSRQAKKIQHKKRPQKKKKVKRPETRKPTKKPTKKTTRKPARKPVKKTTRKPQAKRVPKKVPKKAPRRRKRPNKLKMLLRAIIGIIGILCIYILNILLDFLKVLFKVNDRKPLDEKAKKKMDFNFYRLFSLTFIGMLCIVGIIILMSPKQVESIEENRKLQQKPEFKISTFWNGTYSKEKAKYLSDQFPDRQRLIKLKASMDRLEGQKEINGVYIGKDGYLMEGFKKASEESLDNKVHALNAFSQKYPKLKTSIMLVPNKVEIYRHFLPKNVPVDSQKEYIEDVYKMLDNNIEKINVMNSFQSNKNSERLYFKTDHHWTTDGAYKAYVDYCKGVNIEPVVKGKYKKSLATKKFKGSLYYKNGAQIGEPESMYLYLKETPEPIVAKYEDISLKKASIYDYSKIKSRDPYEVFTGGNHDLIRIRTAVKSDRRLLLVKDSYANAMLPYLVDTFSEIVVVDPRYFVGSFDSILENYSMTDVLFLYNVNTFNSDNSILSITD